LTALNDEQEQHRVFVNLANVHAALGDRATALSDVDRAAKLLPDDPAAACERQKLLALVYYFTRDFPRAAIESEKAVDMARAAGFNYEVMVNLHNMGDVLVHCGDMPRAYGAIRQSLALCDEGGYERLGNYNRMFIAFLDGIAGTSDGEQALRKGIAYAEAREFTWDVIGGRALLAKLLERRGNEVAAHNEFERVRDIALAAGHRFVAEDCDIALDRLDRTRLDATS
jgi:tetratricopeptide (TPR) repeat protein